MFFFDPSQTAQSCNAAEGNLHLWPLRALNINHASESDLKLKTTYRRTTRRPTALIQEDKTSEEKSGEDKKGEDKNKEATASDGFKALTGDGWPTSTRPDQVYPQRPLPPLHAHQPGFHAPGGDSKEPQHRGQQFRHAGGVHQKAKPLVLRQREERGEMGAQLGLGEAH